MRYNETPMQQSKDLQLAIKATRKAAVIIKEGFGRITSFKVKPGKGIVTEIDHASEAAIIQILQQGSDYPILAEESGRIGASGDSFWVIDPLDGTRNFQRGIPIFCVSIALIKNNSVALGVTLNPVNGDIYFAEKGRGAYLNDKSLKVSKITDSLVLALNKGYSPEADIKFIKTVERLSPTSVLRRLGSTALELAFVAAGVLEGYISFGDELWDYAAGVLMIEEAGGKVTDWKGNEWDIENKYVLATSVIINDKIKALVSDLQ